MSLARRVPYVYRLWNHHVKSDFDLGELDPDRGPASEAGLEAAPSTIRLLRATGPAWPQPKNGVFENRLENSTVWQESWESMGGYVSRFPSLCSFRIFPETMRIECAPEPDLDPATLAHLALDHAIPRLFSMLPGCIVLHSSAIAMNGGVVAVLGESGRGKSTLATWLSMRKYPVLTDDCLLLRRGGSDWRAIPGYRSVRLWPDSLEVFGIEWKATRDFAGSCPKRRTGAEASLRFTRRGAPLAHCFVLADPSESGPPTVRPLGVNEAFLALAKSVFRLAVVDPEMNRREFEALTELAATVRFWSLSYRREYDELPAVEQAITETIQAGPQELEAQEAVSMNPPERYEIPKSVLSRKVGTETILMNLETSTYHSLNSVGSRFWTLIQEGKSYSEAVTVLCSEYDVKRERLESDLNELCRKLERLSLLRRTI